MKTNKFYYLALAMTFGLAACNSAEGDDPGAPPTNQPNVLNLVPAQATKVAFTSNDYDLSQGAVVTWETVETDLIDRDAEATLVQEVLPEQNGNVDELDLDFLYYAEDGDLTLELYPVFAQSGTEHTLGIFYYDEKGIKHEAVIWEKMNKYTGFVRTEWVWNSETETSEAKNYSKGLKITVKKGYKFGFYWNGNNNSGVTTYYSQSSLNEDVVCTNGGGDWLDGNPTSTTHAGTFVRNGKTYLGLEDWTDFDYQDLVFTCDKEIATVDGDDIYPTPDEPVVDPVDPTEPDEPVVDPVDPTEPDKPVVEPVDPADPEVVGGNGSVEINLALNAEHEQGDWVESHLSIHVRDTTDVTVFLPVSAEYYCPADDMMIVQKHDEAYQYNETAESVSMDINGNVVTLNVTFAENGITISTQGINADVLKYLRSMYGDGLTFEVRNYYNESVTNRSVLQNILNNSVVTFDTAPKIFVNAFGKTEDVVDPLACTVKPADEYGYSGPAEKDSEHESALLYVYEK